MKTKIVLKSFSELSAASLAVVEAPESAASYLPHRLPDGGASRLSPGAGLALIRFPANRQWLPVRFTPPSPAPTTSSPVCA